VARLRTLGYEAELITPARAEKLAPDLVTPVDASLIAYSAHEAHRYPQLYLAYLLRTASHLDVQVISNTAVQTFGTAGGRPVVRLTDGTSIVCDQVVTCVGRWTQTLLAQAHGPLSMTTFEHPGDATVRYTPVTSPLPVSLTRLITTSRLNVHPNGGGGRPVLQSLGLDATADSHDVPATDSPVAKELLERLRTC